LPPSTYYENVAKRVDVDRLSIRTRRDISLKIEIRRVFEQNYRVYGVRKVWRQLKREGFDVARCTVARLMRAMSLQGIIQGNEDNERVYSGLFDAEVLRQSSLP